MKMKNWKEGEKAADDEKWRCESQGWENETQNATVLNNIGIKWVYD